LLYYLLIPLTKYFGALRIVRYISFRAAAAAVTALLVAFIVGPIIVRALRRLQMHQVVREGTPDTHKSKNMTPTMGGLIILAATIVPRASVPTTKEMNAATTGEPDALPRIALVGACMAMKIPAITARDSGKAAAFIWRLLLTSARHSA
jgi:UDP-N-acetylmuramyl pentapeptide phosphotransferase/UDP-N-acetylglucosamine-1-phosphate transferase